MPVWHIPVIEKLFTNHNIKDNKEQSRAVLYAVLLLHVNALP